MDWSFLKGFADETLDSVKVREAEERKKREMEMLRALQRETSDYEFKRKRESELKEVKRQTFDPKTGESVDYNIEGTELGRRKDPMALEEYQLGKRKSDLEIRNIESQIASRSEENALRRQALLQKDSNDETGGRGKKDRTLYAANATQQNLEKFGFTPAEMARVRPLLLKGVEENWTPEQFARFERVYLEEQNKNKRTNQLSNASVAEEIFGKLSK